MGVRIGSRTVYITDGENVVHQLNPGDDVPSKLEKYFVSGLQDGHRALSNGRGAAEVESDDESGDEQGDGYAAWLVPKLKAELKKRELPQTGSKAELVERLNEDDAEQEDLGSDEQSGDEGSDGDESGDEQGDDEIEE